MPGTFDVGLRRVAVQTDAGRLDLSLAADATVAAMLPAIVDMAATANPAVSFDVPTSWILTRVGGEPLSSQHSLRANDVSDGDLLVLARVAPPLSAPPVDDSTAAIATSLDQVPRWTPLTSRLASAGVSLCCSAIVAYALLHGTCPQSAVIAGSLGIAAFIAAAICQRVYRADVAAATLAVLSIVGATAAGFLVVPGAAASPKLVLAAAGGATASILAIRCIDSNIIVFTATATFGVLGAAGCCPGLVVPLEPAATGSVIAAVATVIVASATRLALWAGRLPAPRLTDASGFCDQAGAADRDVLRAHQIATGLICGSSAAVAGGAIVATSGTGSVCPVFAVVLGLAMTSRAGTHVDLLQVSALFVSGTTCFAVAFVWLVNARPQDAHWIAVVAAAVAAGSVRWSAGAVPINVSPVVRKCGELTEYAALAAVVPLTCLLSGAFGAVRGLA
jgi:type VII secretion integral membrane protein EccD